MAHYHFTAKARSRRGGRSTVDQLAYRSATELKDQRNGQTYSYANRGDVFEVDVLVPEGAPDWIVGIASEVKVTRQSGLQKLSDIFEAAEKRRDARVYREVEFALPNELTNEQNIAWSKGFIQNVFCSQGMVAIVNYHGKVDEKTGIYKPHCHVLLSTRTLMEDGLSYYKNRDWDTRDLVKDARAEYAAYQNAALEHYGFEARVSHLSYKDQEVDIDAQPKLGQKIREMMGRGILTDKQKIFDLVRLKNQFKVLKEPELVFKIVTALHSTFTQKDIAKVLHRYIDDGEQFQAVLSQLMASKELVPLDPGTFHRETQEPVYTTRDMARRELAILQQADELSANQTHPVAPEIIEKVIATHHQKFSSTGGLNTGQEAAIRHMLSPHQLACVVGFAGAGKSTCLEAVQEAWEQAGYKVLGLAPTGKAARNMEGSGIRSMTIHKFLYLHQFGREQLTDKTIIVGDEFGMVDSRRCAELLSLVDQAGAKIVPMGDRNQTQAVEAGPAFRLLIQKARPVVLEKVVRQQTDWQREATRLFGTTQARAAVQAYLDQGCIRFIQEPLPDFNNPDSLLDNFCLARQVSGRMWKEMMEDFKAGSEKSFDPKTDFGILATHADFDLFQEWKGIRQGLVESIITTYEVWEDELKDRGVDVAAFAEMVGLYRQNPQENAFLFKDIEAALRQMSYRHTVDTRQETREGLAAAWAKDYHASPEQSHLMLAFTNKDAHKLNETARTHMKTQGVIQGRDYGVATQGMGIDDFGEEYRTHHTRAFAKGDRILFTRNDNSLGVKNGSLGTIHHISKNKITVALDTEGDTKKTVSFSPVLYPFIDNGWATTVIKAQGITVDHTKLLASFEDYRNMAYVGMSRHRLTLEVFGSSLDFWREEKVVDRLGRVQEKLSGVDYLDIPQLQEKLAEDTDILWRQRKAQQGKNLWNAIKASVRDIFGKARNDRQTGPTVPQGHKNIPILPEEGYLSFEDTEEMRSRDFFSDASGMRSKGVFEAGEERGKEQTEERRKEQGEKQAKEQKEGDPSPNREQGSQRASHRGSPSQDPGKRSTSSQPEKPGPLHPSPQSTNQPGAAYPYQTYQRCQPSGTSSPLSNKKGVEEQIQAVVTKINQEKGYKTVLKRRFLSFKEIEDQLKERVFELATSLIDMPLTVNTPRELRFGKGRKIRVALSGEYRGFYHNFETGVQGGILKLIEDQQGLSPKEAVKWAVEWLGGNPVIMERHATIKKKEAAQGTIAQWTPVIPVPKEKENPDISKEWQLRGMVKDGWREAARYAYRDDVGNLKGYVVRLERPNGDKVEKRTPPLAYCVNEAGKKEWRWLGFEKDNKTPYRIEALAQDPHKPVLVVEGEKTADAAQKLLPEYTVLTWGGGAGNVGKTNWECLVGKAVVIWPDYDYDQGGQLAAQKLYNIITQLNREKGQNEDAREGRVAVVDLPKYLPHPEYLPNTWDLGDKLPEGWTVETIRGHLADTLGQAPEKPPMLPVPEKTEHTTEQDTGHPAERPISPPEPPRGTPQKAGAPSSASKSQSDSQREAFEASRLLFHQEWCATFGFMEKHRRFPETVEDLNEAYWQGERLAAIEGRLYQGIRDRGGRIHEDKLTLRARAELAQNQKVPGSLLTLGKAFDLTPAQLQQFEEHVLMYRDRTNCFPEAAVLGNICEAIKVYDQNRQNGEAYNQDAISLERIDTALNTSVPPQPSPAPLFQKVVEGNTPQNSLYRRLVEQQAILGKIQSGQDIQSAILKSLGIESSCAQKFKPLNEKIQLITQLSQDVRDRELNRQTQRGMDL